MIWKSCIQLAFFTWIHRCFKASDLNRSEGIAKIYFRYLLLFVTKKIVTRKDKIRRWWNLTEKEPSKGRIFPLKKKTGIFATSICKHCNYEKLHKRSSRADEKFIDAQVRHQILCSLKKGINNRDSFTDSWYFQFYLLIFI